MERSGGDSLGAGDRETGRDAGALIHRGGFAQVTGEAGQDLDEVLGHLGGQIGLLGDDGHLVVEGARVVRADLGAEAVLERSDDPAAVGVILRVGAGDDEDVERQAEHVAADLDVALLHHVEHRHLDALGQVGQLVDGDDAAVAARDEAEVDGLRITQGAPLGHLDGVDVTDEVGHRGVRGGELLGVTLIAVHPGDGQFLAQLLGSTDGRRGDRLEGVLTQLGALDHRRPLVEQADERAQDPGLALAALAQQDDVVAGDDRPLHLRDHRIGEPVQAGPGISPFGERGEEVVPQLGLQRFLDVVGGAQLTQGGRSVHAFESSSPHNIAALRRNRRHSRVLMASRPARAT